MNRLPNAPRPLRTQVIRVAVTLDYDLTHPEVLRQLERYLRGFSSEIRSEEVLDLAIEEDVL